MKSHSEQEFLKRAKKTLDDSVSELDKETLEQLRFARQQAVQLHANRQPKTRGWDYRIPAAVAATLIVAVLVTTLWGGSNQIPSEFEDLDLLVSNENIEFYENLDFYSWLTEQDSAG